MIAPPDNLIGLFDSSGRRLELVVDRFCQSDRGRQLKAKPRTYRDLNLATAIFTKARSKLVNPENDIQKSIADCDAENAINEDGFARDVLDYIELLRLGVVHLVAPLPSQSFNNLGASGQVSQLGGSQSFDLSSRPLWNREAQS